MRYDVFDKVKEQNNPAYRTQEHMEETFREVTKPAVSRESSLNDRLAPEYLACSSEEKSLTLLFHGQTWMSNTGGNMHGGLIAAISDMSMGLLARYYKGSKSCVTVQLSINYTRGIPLPEEVTVVARAEKIGKNIFFMSSSIYRSDGGLAAYATAEFM